jgi:hypothetical protein
MWKLRRSFPWCSMNRLEPLPEHARRVLAKRGIWPADIRIAAMADLSREGVFAQAWVVLTGDGLAVVEGPAAAPGAREASGERRHLTAWRETGFILYKLDEIERLNAESLPSGGVLAARVSGADVVLSRYTNSAARKFGVFAELFAKVKEGQELTDADFSDDRAPSYCPKCGLLYPDQERAVCPRCLDKRSLFARVLSFAPRYRVQIGLIIACMVTSSALRLLAPFVSGRVFFDEVLARKGRFVGTVFPLVHFVMGIGGLQVVKGTMTFGTLITFTGYIAMIYGPLEFMTQIVDWWSSCMNSAQRIFEVLDAVPDVTESPNPVRMERIRGSIELKDVTFSYEPNKPVLQDINLTIGAGEMVELGTHESLLKARGVYYNLEMKQRQTSRLRAVEG